MKEFNYNLAYKKLNFTKPINRSLYRIGRGEQGVLLVRPYTNIICKHWRFKTPDIALKSARTIYKLFCNYLTQQDFIGADMCRKFLEMGFTRARRYANHHSGKKYDVDRNVLPQEKDSETCRYARSADIFLRYRRRAARDVNYIQLRKKWRNAEI